MSTPTPAQLLRVALAGAGVFARDAHLPSLLRHPDRFEIVALYSRSHASAATLAAQLPHPTTIYTDFDALLAQPEIEAVDIVLPIAALPAAIVKTLDAGKHLLSEKPIDADVPTGRELLAHYLARPTTRSDQVWMVGENWRYETAFVRAAAMIRDGQIGTPLTCHWALFTPITANSKYYHTLWRRDSSVPGGFITDGGVHHLAALRLLFGEISQVSATVRQNSPDLPPADTVAATLTFANGVTGTYFATYAIGAPWPPLLHIVGTEGTLRVQRREIEWTRAGQSERMETAGFDGVEQELLAFAESIRTGTPHRNSPEEALRDLAAVEALLTSAAIGQAVTPVVVV
jgi:predicted dehydrogenase